MIANNATGEAIRQAFEEAGKTVEEVEKELPADRATIYRYRQGKHLQPDTIVRLSDVLHSPWLLPKFCGECPVGKARRKLNLKRSQKKEKPRYLNRGYLRNFLKKLYPKTA